MSTYLISCGGTGGHLSPGISLAEGLTGRGHAVTLLISQKKVDARLIEKYPQFDFLRVPGTGFTWNPLGLLRCVFSQLQGFVLSCGSSGQTARRHHRVWGLHFRRHRAHGLAAECAGCIA